MLEQFYEDIKVRQERMRRRSKAQFRSYLLEQAAKLGLEATIYPKSWASKNVVVGNIHQADLIIGAHYDTPPIMFRWMANHLILFNIVIILMGWFILPIMILTFIPVPLGIWVYFAFIIFFICYLMGFLAIPNRHNMNDNSSGVLAILTLMSEVRNDKVAYVFFDNEEKGLVGSLLLAKQLKKLRKNYIVLDCVGTGTIFTLYHYNKPFIADRLKMLFDIKSSFPYSCEVKKGGYLATSDHMSFMHKNHVGIMSLELRNNKKVLRDIHSRHDKTINLENIRVLCDWITRYIGDKYGNFTREKTE